MSVMLLGDSPSFHHLYWYLCLLATHFPRGELPVKANLVEQINAFWCKERILSLHAHAILILLHPDPLVEPTDFRGNFIITTVEFIFQQLVDLILESSVGRKSPYDGRRQVQKETYDTIDVHCSPRKNQERLFIIIMVNGTVIGYMKLASQHPLLTKAETLPSSWSIVL
jgi:hypothetical protein